MLDGILTAIIIVLGIVGAMLSLLYLTMFFDTSIPRRERLFILFHGGWCFFVCLFVLFMV